MKWRQSIAILGETDFPGFSRPVDPEAEAAVIFIGLNGGGDFKDRITDRGETVGAVGIGEEFGFHHAGAVGQGEEFHGLATGLLMDPGHDNEAAEHNFLTDKVS